MQPDKDTQAIEIRLLLEAIHSKYGYDLRDYAKPSLERRVLAALAKSGLPNLGELQHQILTDAALFGRVLDDLTVRVSGFFRDPKFHLAFRDRVVPYLRTYPLLRIWHAGCAGGEEVYANAIVLHEEGLYDRCQLYATDVSPGALEHAKDGVYPAQDLPELTKNYREAGGRSDPSIYYTAAYDRIAIKEPLRRNVLFFQHNLVSDHVFGEMQVVFCRNVLIYFEESLRRRVLAKLAESLCAGGFLCLGSSEKLSRASHEAFVELSEDGPIYRYEP